MGTDGEAAQLLEHPVRFRVILALGGRTLTTKQLRQALPDVAQATLYRHVAAMVKAGFLAVVEERPVRGTVERSYALGERMAHVGEEQRAEMGSAQLRAAFLNFLRMLGEGFDHAVEQETADDRWVLGFGHTILYLADADLPGLQTAMAELMLPYQTEPAADDRSGRRRVLLSTALISQQAGQTGQDDDAS